MLNNLKYSFASGRQFKAALRAIDLIDQVWPDQPDNVRDRGLMKAALHRYSDAIHDLERYAALAPQAPDAKKVLERIRQIKKSFATLN
jgi:regulator of sirC expression with transglutaminase-like and TPR domain